MFLKCVLTDSFWCYDNKYFFNYLSILAEVEKPCDTVFSYKRNSLHVVLSLYKISYVIVIVAVWIASELIDRCLICVQSLITFSTLWVLGMKKAPRKLKPSILYRESYQRLIILLHMMLMFWENGLKKRTDCTIVPSKLWWHCVEEWKVQLEDLQKKIFKILKTMPKQK